jgi:hypothetical protein
MPHGGSGLSPRSAVSLHASGRSALARQRAGPQRWRCARQGSVRVSGASKASRTSRTVRLGHWDASVDCGRVRMKSAACRRRTHRFPGQFRARAVRRRGHAPDSARAPSIVQGMRAGWQAQRALLTSVRGRVVPPKMTSGVPSLLARRVPRRNTRVTGGGTAACELVDASVR